MANTDIFQLDKSNYPTREVIKVIGVGGAGNNALNHIIRGGVSGVEFIAVNTDLAHLEISESQNRMVIGKELTKGLGAGSNPEVGFKAAQESRDDIRAAVEGADMVFLAAGMGGGTGTGAAPVIAQIAREADALVIAVVTLPFTFEGKRRIAQALHGIEVLKDKVDALIVIPNDKLLNISDHKTLINEAFGEADNILHQAVQGVTDLILRPGIVNVDFADVRTVMSNAGPAIMGIGEGYGDNRAQLAATNAINSRLMDTRMNGARGILVNITGANVRIHEVNEAVRIITEAANENAYIIWGHVYDPDMGNNLQITVIATGFDELPDYAKQYDGGYNAVRVPVQQQEKTAERPAVTETAVPFGMHRSTSHRLVYNNKVPDDPANFSEKVRPLIRGEQFAEPVQYRGNETREPAQEMRSAAENIQYKAVQVQENPARTNVNLFQSGNDANNYDTPSILRRRLKKQDEE